MFDSAKADAAQEKYCSDHHAPHFAPNRNVSYRCFRCDQNIYAEYGHPVAERLKRGRVRLAWDVKIPGISVEKAGKELICGCPFCCASFDD